MGKIGMYSRKNAFKLLIENCDIKLLLEFLIQNKPVEYGIEFYFQKPLNECSLKEVLDGIVIIARITNWFDTVDYMDNGSHYTMIMPHGFGPNASRINTIVIESGLKTCGVKAESTIYPKTIFVKRFKNQ